MHANYSAVLRKLFTFHQDGLAPSWQTRHPTNSSVFFSVDEGNPGGVLSLYLDRSSSKVVQLSRSDAINGTVNLDIVNNLVVVADYSGHSVQTFNTNNYGLLSEVIQSFTYSLDQIGPNKARQDSSHPHQALIDRSSSLIIVPDLGADLLRLYRISNGSSVVELAPVSVSPGSGPRHGQILNINRNEEQPLKNLYCYYLVNELKNTVAVYSFTDVEDGTVSMTKIQEVGTLDPTRVMSSSLSTPTAGELVISKDKRFLYVSNRNDYSFSSPESISDSIALYQIDSETGMLEFITLLPAGGITPRHFSFDPTGNYLATVFQESNSIVIHKVAPLSGLFMEPEHARMPIEGGPVCVLWL